MGAGRHALFAVPVRVADHGDADVVEGQAFQLLGRPGRGVDVRVEDQRPVTVVGDLPGVPEEVSGAQSATGEETHALRCRPVCAEQEHRNTSRSAWRAEFGARTVDPGRSAGLLPTRLARSLQGLPINPVHGPDSAAGTLPESPGPDSAAGGRSESAALIPSPGCCRDAAGQPEMGLDPFFRYHCEDARGSCRNYGWRPVGWTDHRPHRSPSWGAAPSDCCSPCSSTGTASIPSSSTPVPRCPTNPGAAPTTPAPWSTTAPWASPTGYAPWACPPTTTRESPSPPGTAVTHWRDCPGPGPGSHAGRSRHRTGPARSPSRCTGPTRCTSNGCCSTGPVPPGTSPCASVPGSPASGRSRTGWY